MAAADASEGADESFAREEVDGVRKVKVRSQSHYPHLPRENEQENFRLLVLKPGGPKDSIECHLRTVNLGESENQQDELGYEAVSHVWGSEEDVMAPIGLGAWSVPVRENLYGFLKQIRSPNKDKTLWVDALCINQDNFEERADQVQIMGRIYRGAQRALVWLGTNDDEMLLAMELIEQISKDPNSAANINDREYSVLLKWAQQPYWTRTWVVQEFLLARDIRVVFGERGLDWSTLSSFMHHFRRDLAEDPSWTPFVNSPAYILMQQRISEGTLDSPLERLLVQNQHTRCKDPHDKVYAMLGLAAQPAYRRKIQPDYNKHVRGLVFDVLEHCDISANNRARFVRFLVQLLKIGRDTKPLPGPRRSIPSDCSWTFTGFSVGRIIRCSTLEEQHNTAALNANYEGNYRMKRVLRDYRSADVTRMIRELGELDSTKLKSSYSFLETTQERIEGCRTANLVAVLTSNTLEPEISLGMALGKIKENDQVVYFLGHPVGMVLKQGEPDLGSSKVVVVGIIVCARANENMETRDQVTQQISKYWTLQTEGYLTNRSSLKFHLSELEVLRFGQ